MRRIPPLPPLHDLGALASLAAALEAEAARRYRDLAARMRAAGQAELADLFGFLAELEAKHEGQVIAYAGVLGASPDPARIGWEVPESFDEEAARSASLTPYVALSIAVRNEERAFAFYCRAAAGAPANVAALAEGFARDELEHAAILRRARRAAWRREGRRPAPPLPAHAAALRQQARAVQARLAAGLAPLVARLRAEGQDGMADVLDGIVQDAGPSAESGPEFGDVPSALRALEAEVERLAALAERGDDMRLVAAAQEEAERALGWLALASGSWRNTLLSA